MGFEPEPVPLVKDEAGRLMIRSTRIPLERIIIAHQLGESPEYINEGFPTVPLADVYAVISYYLHHRDEVDAYLAEQDRKAAEVRAQIEARFPQEGLRTKLLARLEK